MTTENFEDYKIVFLDIDGVLNTKKFLESRDNLEVCDSENVKNFNKIVNKIKNLKIVVSSSWRLHREFDELVKVLKEQGVKGEIIDTTPNMTGKFDATRSNEIQSWLNTHDVQEFVILDDENISWDLSKNHVKTSFYKNGLTEDHVEKAIKILNGDLK